mmetsp:Transcript_38144/g.96512  ORF Transcript_38144/g.96512 Transcript_38144/m.96512 type:complete len:458 (+) Transcript_38144:509-1882(+)
MHGCGRALLAVVARAQLLVEHARQVLALLLRHLGQRRQRVVGVGAAVTQRVDVRHHLHGGWAGGARLINQQADLLGIVFTTRWCTACSVGCAPLTLAINAIGCGLRLAVGWRQNAQVLVHSQAPDFGLGEGQRLREGGGPHARAPDAQPVRQHRAVRQRDLMLRHLLHHAFAQVDAAPYELARRVLAQGRVERSQHLTRLHHRHAHGARPVGVQALEVLVDQVGQLPRHLHAGGAAAHNHDVQQPLPLLLRPAGDARPGHVVDEPGADGFRLVHVAQEVRVLQHAGDAERGALAACGQHQLVVGHQEGLPVIRARLHHLAVGVHCSRLGDEQRVLGLEQRALDVGDGHGHRPRVDGAHGGGRKQRGEHHVVALADDGEVIQLGVDVVQQARAAPARANHHQPRAASLQGQLLHGGGRAVWCTLGLCVMVGCTCSSCCGSVEGPQLLGQLRLQGAESW